MKITADANLLVRAIVADDLRQARLAQSALETSELVAVTTVTLCEFVWVLSRGYGIAPSDIGAAIRRIIASANVNANRSAVEAGLALLEAGGDFADGAIAHEGASLGAEIFLSFDKDAVKLIKLQGLGAALPG